MKYFKYLALCIILLSTSCRSSKQAAPAVDTTAAVESLVLTPKALYASLADSYKQWDNVYMPVNLSLQSPTSLSASGRATMVRGEEVHISLRMLGFEVAVLYVNADSIYAFEKIHKYYVAEDLRSLLKGVDITISDVQAMLMGQAFLPGKGVVTDGQRGDFEIAVDSDQFVLTPKRHVGNASLEYACTKKALPVLQSLTVSAPGASGVCQYSDNTATIAGNASRLVNLRVNAKGRELAAQLKWDLSGAKWNEAKPIKFSIPKGYQRVSASSLLEMLKNL